MTHPKTHFMPAGNRPAHKREIPTRQEYIWYLDQTHDERDSMHAEFAVSRKKSHHVDARFGQWLYTKRKDEFNARYNAVLGMPSIWASIRKVALADAVETLGGSGR